MLRHPRRLASQALGLLAPPSSLCTSARAVLNRSLFLELTVLRGGFIWKLRILQFPDSCQGPGRASSNFIFKILYFFFNTFPFQICKFQAAQNLVPSRNVLFGVSIFSARTPQSTPNPGWPTPLLDSALKHPTLSGSVPHLTHIHRVPTLCQALF